MIARIHEILGQNISERVLFKCYMRIYIFLESIIRGGPK